MSHHQYLMLYKLAARATLTLMTISPAFALVPIAAQASSSSSVAKSSSSAVAHTGSIDASSLFADSGSKAYLTGTTSVSEVRVTIIATSTGKTAYKSGTIHVRSGNWHVTSSKRLADGMYTVSLYEYAKGKTILLRQGLLYVGIRPVTLKVSPIALLAGGTAASGSTVPISYLQVTNAGDASTTIAGFWIQEDGTAPVSAVIGFSSVDDKGNNRMSVGGVEGKTPFVGGKAYVPSGAVIAPHQIKLFTIKAQLSANARAFAGASLMLDVAGIDAQANSTATFPIRGTTWVIGR